MKIIKDNRSSLPIIRACDAINFSRSTFYRMDKEKPAYIKRTSLRKLTAAEEQKVLDILHEPRFMDMPPGQVYNHLLDEGVYLASERTMYRILAKHKEVKERRNIRKHQKYKKPELLATQPNQLWSWDITRMRGPNKLEYYHLYVIIDVFSRYIVGWMIANRESAELAKQLISETCKANGIVRESLTIHSDRGPAMKSKTVADLFDYLGITKSHSRPRISNDNPYSEAQFKTMKYCPTYPDRFGSFEDARAFCSDFFIWYNHEHYHSGLKMLTPATVHNGKAEEALANRAKVKVLAYKGNKIRFAKGKPKLQKLPKEVWINPPKAIKSHLVTKKQVVKPLKVKDLKETTK